MERPALIDPAFAAFLRALLEHVAQLIESDAVSAASVVRGWR